MRIDDLLQRHSEGTMSQRQYKRLKKHVTGFHLVFHDPETGWDTSGLDEMTEGEARQALTTHWKLKAYEQKQGIESDRINGFMVYVNHGEEDPRPEWPAELQDYDTDSFPEAYLMDKFNITRPENRNAL